MSPPRRPTGRPRAWAPEWRPTAPAGTGWPSWPKQKLTRKPVPAGSIAAFEVGNEPDIGHRQVANPLTPEQKVPRSPVGWDEYTSSQYTSLFGSYSRAVRRVVPAARMAGPEIFFPGRDLSWLHKLLSADRSRLAMLTVHRYPLSSCASPAWHDYATIARLLGQSASGGLAHELAGAVHVAQDAGVPLRLTELNSVTCGGRLGVSNTFATALWAPDTLFSMWNVGVSGVNLHIQPGDANAPFSVSSAGLVAHPLLYGMIMFARALGSGAELAPVRSSGATSSNVAAPHRRRRHHRRQSGRSAARPSGAVAGNAHHPARQPEQPRDLHGDHSRLQRRARNAAPVGHQPKAA